MNISLNMPHNLLSPRLRELNLNHAGTCHTPLPLVEVKVPRQRICDVKCVFMYQVRLIKSQVLDFFFICHLIFLRGGVLTLAVKSKKIDYLTMTYCLLIAGAWKAFQNKTF